jgi:DnaJ family protein C protein 11
MASWIKTNGQTPPSHDKEFLYTVLNLPHTASAYEIRERYRALSVTFHPDKQHDPSFKDVANRRFLEIQKAYEVLSDPFLREIYDILGEDGLKKTWPTQLRFMPPEEVREILIESKYKEKQDTLEKLIRAKGQVTCVVDMQSMMEPYMGYHDDPWYRRFWNRAQDVSVASLGLKHRFEKRITEKTTLVCRAHVSNGRNVFGTVRHQYNPRWTFEGTTSLLRPNLSLKAAYQDEASYFAVNTTTPPLNSLASRLSLPTLNLNFSHRLFRDALTQGSLGMAIGPHPAVNIEITKPTPFGLQARGSAYTDGGRFPTGLGSDYGFGSGAHFWTCGLVMGPMGPTLRSEWGITFTEIAIQLKTSLQYGLATGLAWLWTSSWADDDTQLISNISLSAGGVVLYLEFVHLEQRLSLPITLASDYDPSIALWTSIVPSTALALIYRFVIQPKRRRQRLDRIRAARRAAKEEVSASGVELEATISMLKETARRHMSAEHADGGLTILEAYYGSTEKDENGQELMVDVTIPVQALVHHSQLYIPGHRSKSGIQGFHDPAPSIPKILRVRYAFRGKLHFAEIPDYLPVVLPLQDHCC